MGNGASSANGSSGSKPSGKDGVYPTADAAVLAAEAAFAKYRKRPLACRQQSGPVHPRYLRLAGR